MNKLRYYASQLSPMLWGEYRVRITSRPGGGKVYVSRLIKSRNEWSKQRWLLDEAKLRVEEVQS